MPHKINIAEKLLLCKKQIERNTHVYFACYYMLEIVVSREIRWIRNSKRYQDVRRLLSLLKADSQRNFFMNAVMPE